VPWAAVGRDLVIGWIPVDDDPDGWPVMVEDAHYAAVRAQRLTATQLLLRLLL
jgi:hypothetical protein